VNGAVNVYSEGECREIADHARGEQNAAPARKCEEVVYRESVQSHRSSAWRQTGSGR